MVDRRPCRVLPNPLAASFSDRPCAASSRGSAGRLLFGFPAVFNSVDCLRDNTMRVCLCLTALLATIHFASAGHTATRQFTASFGFVAVPFQTEPFKTAIAAIGANPAATQISFTCSISDDRESYRTANRSTDRFIVDTQASGYESLSVSVCGVTILAADSFDPQNALFVQKLSKNFFLDSLDRYEVTQRVGPATGSEATITEIFFEFASTITCSRG